MDNASGTERDFKQYLSKITQAAHNKGMQTRACKRQRFSGAPDAHLWTASGVRE
jgi:hypothetical protein